MNIGDISTIAGCCDTSRIGAKFDNVSSRQRRLHVKHKGGLISSGEGMALGGGGFP